MSMNQIYTMISYETSSAKYIIITRRIRDLELWAVAKYSLDFLIKLAVKLVLFDELVPALFKLFATELDWKHVVTQQVEALRYKPEGRGMDSRWCHWNFSLT
jgi:hypothetical protein